MEYIFGIICGILIIALFIMYIRFLSLKRNIRHFVEEMERQKDVEYGQPVKVSDFDPDIVKLAVKINEFTTAQRNRMEEYDEKKKQLDTMISGISHDFRTPLTSSLGYIQMIEKSGELSEKNAERLKIVEQKNQYMKDLSDEFFEATKLESNTEQMQFEMINLSNVLTEKLLEQHGWIDERNMKTDFDIRDGIVVKADSHFLMRVLDNLFSNAYKYADDRISVSLQRESEQGDVTLKISNSVAGEDVIEVDRVFDPFYRMKSRTAGGSGLGLYVVKICCDKMKWKVKAETGENGDFTLTVICPE